MESTIDFALHRYIPLKTVLSTIALGPSLQVSKYDKEATVEMAVTLDGHNQENLFHNFECV